jgi:teichuronic acid biosynthesis glycosyltransferase TuaH
VSQATSESAGIRLQPPATRLEHWIVAGQPPARAGGQLFRRDRLARHLADRADTARVVWVYPRHARGLRVHVSDLPGGVVSLGLPRGAGLLHYGVRAPLPRYRAALRFGAGVERILWFTHPSFPALLHDGSWRTTVYDCSDVWSAWRSLHANREARRWRAAAGEALMLRAERFIARHATFVTASSPYLAEHLLARYGRRADAIVENGVDLRVFGGLPAAPERSGQRIGFMGGLKVKIDFELLERLAAAFPDVEIALAGPISRKSAAAVAALRRRPNVRYLGSLSPEQIPEFAATLDVGLLPYRIAEYNRGVSPLKLFEYLAAGVPVVGIGLPTTTKYDRPAVYRHVQDSDSFIAECRSLLDRADRAEDRAERRRVAGAQGWETKLDSMLELASQLPSVAL